jgi:hypothetical protein
MFQGQEPQAEFARTTTEAIPSKSETVIPQKEILQQRSCCLEWLRQKMSERKGKLNV